MCQTAVRLQSYTALDNYSGKAFAIDITAPGIAGRWYRRGTAAPNIGMVRKDALGRSWERAVESGSARMSWFEMKGDGSDETAQMEAAILACPGLTLCGEPGKTYRFVRELQAQNFTDIDFRGAAVIDDVRDFWPSSDAGRAAPLFNLYGTKFVTIKNFDYSAAPTRATLASSDVPTPVFWIGDNRHKVLLETQFFDVRKINATNCAPGTMFFSISGNTHNGYVKDININGACAYGLNIEYGAIVTSPTEEGAYPFNITVENFNGYDNEESKGFLRAAGCHNIRFVNCYGRDVRSFLFCWTGDRSITKVSQSVVFENVTHFATPGFASGVVNYCLTILSPNKDGSTGDQLPAWTNHDHCFTFINLQLQNNKTHESACVRFIGSQGRTVFEGGVMQGSHYGVRAEPGANPNYVSYHSLEFNGTVFKDNVQDARLVGISGVILDNTKHKGGTGGASPISIEGGSQNIQLKHAKFSGIKASRAYVSIDNGSPGNTIDDCDFDTAGAVPPLSLLSQTNGSRNIYSGAYLVAQGWAHFGLSQQMDTLVGNIADVPSTTLDARKRRVYEVQTGSVNKTINSLIGGKVGDVVVVNCFSTIATVRFTHMGTSDPATRIFTPTGSDVVKTGSNWTVNLRMSTAGWVLS